MNEVAIGVLNVLVDTGELARELKLAMELRNSAERRAVRAEFAAQKRLEAIEVVQSERNLWRAEAEMQAGVTAQLHEQLQRSMMLASQHYRASESWKKNSKALVDNTAQLEQENRTLSQQYRNVCVVSGENRRSRNAVIDQQSETNARLRGELSRKSGEIALSYVAFGLMFLAFLLASLNH